MLFAFEDRFALFDMTPVDNQFIQEFLPAARGDDVRVYLYGLMRCYHPEQDMSLEQMSRDLNLSTEEIGKAYRYWERRGLIRRVSDDPPAYQYVSLRLRGMSGRDPEPDPEYEAFAESLYGVFDNGRRLHGGEIRTCYEWVEDLKLPQEVVLMLLKHMERNKGKNFSIQSAGQVALQMAQENVRTVEEAEQFLTRDQETVQGTKAVLKLLGRRNPPSEGQLAMYRKWTREWGFTREAIEAACAETAKGDPSMGFLDGILRNIHERAVPGTRIDETGVRNAQEESEGLKKVLKALGSGSVTAENLDWYRRIRAAYPEEMILLAAREAGRGRGKPADAEKMLDSWKQKGITGIAEAEEYVREFRAQGELLLELRKTWGLDGRMGTGDRAMLNEWEKELGFSREAVLAAAKAATGAERPMLYLNRILREYAEKGIRTPEEIRRERESFEKNRTADKPRPGRIPASGQYVQRDYREPEESMDEVLNRLGGGSGPDA